MKDLSHIHSPIQAEDGEKGYSKSCFGKNANHNIVKTPVGTIVRSVTGEILCDLNKKGMMFIAARGGAGGHGNAFFKSDTHQSPEICEYGAVGEDIQYVLEIKSMAHIGLVSIFCALVCLFIIRISIIKRNTIVTAIQFILAITKNFVIQNI